MSQPINQEIKKYINKCVTIADSFDGSRFIVKLFDELETEDRNGNINELRKSFVPLVPELVISMCREGIQLLNLNLSLYQNEPLGSTILTRATIERTAKAFFLVGRDESGAVILGRTLNEFLYYRYHEWNQSRLAVHDECTLEFEAVDLTWKKYIEWVVAVKACHLELNIENDPSEERFQGRERPKGWARLKFSNAENEFVAKIENLFSRVDNGALAKPMYSHLSSVAHHNITSLLVFDRIKQDSSGDVILSSVIDQSSRGARSHAEHWFLWSCVGVYSVICEILEQFEPENQTQELNALSELFEPVFTLLLTSERSMRKDFESRAR